MMIQCCQSSAEVLIRLLLVIHHEVCSHEDTVELNCLSIERMHMFQRFYSLVCSNLELLVVQRDLAYISQCSDIFLILECSLHKSSHLTALQSILNLALLLEVLVLIRKDPVWKVPQPICLALGHDFNPCIESLRRTEGHLSLTKLLEVFIFLLHLLVVLLSHSISQPITHTFLLEHFSASVSTQILCV
jgi:hypothetical protein